MPDKKLRVLCAPNALKGTLAAAAAAEAMAAGVLDAGADAILCPVADGGDGTLDVLLTAYPRARIDEIRVSGPLGGQLLARLGWLDHQTAIVELAETSGLRRLHGRLEPMRASSRGCGELIAAALDRGARHIVVGVGGSACTDGGAGILMALGIALTNENGLPIDDGGAGLASLAHADASGTDPWLKRCRIQVAVDVNNPLHGEMGSARVFAPQKGATKTQVQKLEAGLEKLAQVLERDLKVDTTLRQAAGAGAAGGAAFGLAVLGAEITPGAKLICNGVKLNKAMSECDLVLTAEGLLDDQTSMGKAPYEVATRARERNIDCICIAGAVKSIPEGFASAISLTDIAERGEDPKRHTKKLLRRAAAMAIAH